MGTQQSMHRQRARRRRHHRRTGAVLVEFAITVPILFAFFAFLWEFSRAEMIRQTAATAAYEGARQAIVEGGSAADATQAAQAVLDAVGIRNSMITVSPSTISSKTEAVHVAISVPLDSNAFLTPFFMKDLRINSDMTLDR